MVILRWLHERGAIVPAIFFSRIAHVVSGNTGVYKKIIKESFIDDSFGWMIFGIIPYLIVQFVRSIVWVYRTLQQ